jgi:hypothetical protein
LVPFESSDIIIATALESIGKLFLGINGIIARKQLLEEQVFQSK